jgi:PhnB protein
VHPIKRDAPYNTFKKMDIPQPIPLSPWYIIFNIIAYCFLLFLIINTWEGKIFCTHIYFNGNCREAVELYKKASCVKVITVMANPEIGKENEIIHSEIEIHDQKLMLNDFGDNEGITQASGYQLVIQFQSIDELEEMYSVLSKDGKIISPKQPTDYSECVVRLKDKFGIPWALWV